MKRNRVCWIVGLLIWLAAGQTGWSFYNPKTGRWISRDPICEPGLQLGRETNSTLSGGADKSQIRGRSRSGCDEKGYLFVVNNPCGNVDYLGLTPEQTSDIIRNTFAAFGDLCKGDKHCNCPNWGDFKISITLGLSSYEGCVSQAKAATKPLRALESAGGLHGYQINWKYHWQPLPHNWTEVDPVDGTTANNPKFTIDLWNGQIVVDYGDYRREVTLKCEGKSYSVIVRRISNQVGLTPSPGTGDSGMSW